MYTKYCVPTVSEGDSRAAHTQPHILLHMCGQKTNSCQKLHVKLWQRRRAHFCPQKKHHQSSMARRPRAFAVVMMVYTACVASLHVYSRRGTAPRAQCHRAKANMRVVAIKFLYTAKVCGERRKAKRESHTYTRISAVVYAASRNGLYIKLIAKNCTLVISFL